ncbi:MAG: FAD-dependent thymidylate synthase [Candidatus Heimdallarchaeota archaeon]
MVQIKVLDKGFVELIDCLGSDQRVVDAARVSTGTRGDPEQDAQLIRYLMKNRHETPFEKVVFEFHIKCPLFVARQWFRHRISSFNERSARYRVFDEEFYTPQLSDLPQCYSKEDLAEYISALEAQYKVYKKLYKKAEFNPEWRKRAREVWRGLLGTSYYTEFFWTVNFRSLMNFLDLRLDLAAQFEIRQFAKAIQKLIRDSGKIPWSLTAFEERLKTKESSSLTK